MKNINNYKDLLKQFVSFKSISTDSQYKVEILKCVKWLEKFLKKEGAEVKIIEGSAVNPFIFAEFKVSKKAETCLIYGHYDVQPANYFDGWASEPFELDEKEGRFYARGVADNKGQILTYIFTIINLFKQKKLNYNVKFLIEGNEETGNSEMASIIRNNIELLRCDFVIISDGEIVENYPSLDIAFRGGANLTLKITTANTNVHSGIYGGSIPNAIHELCSLISKFYDDENRVAIDGFYEAMDEIKDEEYQNNLKLQHTVKNLVNSIGVDQLKTIEGVDFYTQTGLYPMLTVSGFQGGYTDEGYANIVPGSASCKINFRFVTSQEPKFILSKFKKFVKDSTPNYVKVEIEEDLSYPAIKLNSNTKRYKKVISILEKVYKKQIVKRYVGGSIPVISDFINILKVEVISVSLANEDCNMHGVGENFRIDLIQKGLEFSRKFFNIGS